MRLELQSIEMRNFLSYGNAPQRLDFVEGINLILGKNLGNNRSNGSGKSSLIETIPFAWFGKLSRPVKKENIINWNNKKQCEVKVVFKKGTDTYTILRAIKPDKLEIFCNDTLIPIPPDIRMYQKILENDILGLDYNTFMYLFYTNLNTNVPLLKMNTSQKRSFLERMFLLDTYTELNGVANEKIKGVEDKIFKIDVITEQGKKTINELTEQNNTLRLKLVDITPFEKALSVAKKEYEKKKKAIPEDVVDVVDTETEKIQKLKTDISVLEFNNLHITQQIAESKQKEEERQSKIKEIREKLSLNGDINLKDIEDEIEALYNKTKEDTITKLNISENIARLTERRESLESTYKTLKNGVCPTCKKKVTEKHLSVTYTKDIESLTGQINLLLDSLKECVKRLEENSSNHIKLKQALLENREKQKIKDSLLTTLKTLLDVKTPTYELEEKTIKDNVEKINEYKELCKTYTTSLEKKKAILVLQNELVELLNKLNTLKTELELRKSNRDEIKTIIENNENKIKNIRDEQKTSIGKTDKLKELIDYLSYLKILCKDENVKQFAISSYMSYLVQQTNLYLSRSGSNHYLKFNKWLEEEIHGAGVYGATYGNLSGGESRSIDLAIQFAFLDVAKLKTGIFPDVLLLDEILDSSIDGGGLTNVLNIIKTKQQEDKSKVFIITHRTEISDMEVNNTYEITKENGFSLIHKL